MKSGKEITFIFETSGGRKKGRKSNASSINRHIARASHARRRRGQNSSSSHIPAPLASSSLLNHHAAAAIAKTTSEEDEETLLLSPNKQPSLLVAQLEEPPATPVQIVWAPKGADSLLPVPEGLTRQQQQQQQQLPFRVYEASIQKPEPEEESALQAIMASTPPAATPEADSSPRVEESTSSTSGDSSSIRALDILKHILQTSTSAARTKILTSGSAYAAASSLHIYRDRRMEDTEPEHRAVPVVLGGNYGVYKVRNLVHVEQVQTLEYGEE